jgi:predicted methyltransferase
MKPHSPAAIAGAVLVAVVAGPAMAQTPTYITAAINDPTRPDTDKAQDAVRHPAELLTFSGVKPGDVVMDVWPGKGYWTRLFARVVGPKGHVYAYVPAEIASFKSDPLGIAKKTSAEPGMGNTEAISDPLTTEPPPQFHDVANVVFTFENYHDLHDSFLKGADVPTFDREVRELLKPGGVYLIADQTAAAGSGLKNTEDLHRIDPAFVKTEVTAAGFAFAGQIDVLANPADDHTKLVFDPSIRGKTDRFVFKFVKPAA